MASVDHKSRLDHAPDKGATLFRKRVQAPVEDEALLKMNTILTAPEHQENPLVPYVRNFAHKYQKLLIRLNKILTISDFYYAELRELNLALEKTARTDLLTGASNRKDLYEKMEAERKRAERNGMPFCLILVDIDHFKRINDTYGHDAGDRVLVEVADFLRANIRREDTCARWGGDEFLIIMTSMNLSNVEVVGRKLLNIREAPIVYGEQRIRLTFSMGAAAFRNGQTLDECIKNADIAMYLAKKRGKNQLVVSDT